MEPSLLKCVAHVIHRPTLHVVPLYLGVVHVENYKCHGVAFFPPHRGFIEHPLFHLGFQQSLQIRVLVKASRRARHELGSAESFRIHCGIRLKRARLCSRYAKARRHERQERHERRVGRPHREW